MPTRRSGEAVLVTSQGRRAVTGRHVLLLRHAKSDWSAGGADHDRPLAPRGRRACALLADHFARLRPPPGLVLCSSALRTRQTVEGVRAGLPSSTPVLVEDELYLADAEDLLARLREVDDGVECVLLVGHNPALHQLAVLLLGRDGTAEVPAFPTAALAAERADLKHWAQLAPGVARLEALTTPKQLVSRR